jgi:hypothetical protein
MDLQILGSLPMGPPITKVPPIISLYDNIFKITNSTTWLQKYTKRWKDEIDTGGNRTILMISLCLMLLLNTMIHSQDF